MKLRHLIWPLSIYPLPTALQSYAHGLQNKHAAGLPGSSCSAILCRTVGVEMRREACFNVNWEYLAVSLSLPTKHYICRNRVQNQRSLPWAGASGILSTFSGFRIRSSFASCCYHGPVLLLRCSEPVTTSHCLLATDIPAAGLTDCKRLSKLGCRALVGLQGAKF